MAYGIIDGIVWDLSIEEPLTGLDEYEDSEYLDYILLYTFGDKLRVPTLELENDDA